MTAQVATIHTLQVGQKGSFSSQRLLQTPVHAPTGDGPGGSQYKSQLTIRNLYCLNLCLTGAEIPGELTANPPMLPLDCITCSLLLLLHYTGCNLMFYNV